MGTAVATRPERDPGGAGKRDDLMSRHLDWELRTMVGRRVLEAG